MPNYDLHTHSDYSDGTLSPQELIARAIEKNLETIALTDHDTISGWVDAQNYIQQNNLSINFIKGIEISAKAEFGEIHIVGLNLTGNTEALETKLKQQQQARWERAHKINTKLIKCGVTGVFEHLKNNVKQVVTRTHIARAILELGYVSDMQQAFKKYIGKKGRAKVSQEWVAMGDAIDLIKGAGGVAVLAHPTRYPISNRKLSYLIAEFAESGGQSIEISYPSINKDKSVWLKHHQSKNELYASAGSDFHYPNLKWTDLGWFPDIGQDNQHVFSLLSN